MNRNIPTTNRRKVLKALVGGAATIGVGGAALLAASGPAAAATQDYGSVTISSDDGTVEYVAIYGDSTVEWDGFETIATSFSIDIDARVEGETEWVNLHETGMVALDSSWGNDESLSGPGTSGTIQSSIGMTEGSHDPSIDWHIVGTDPDGYGLPGNSIPASALEVDGDGNSSTFIVQVRSVYAWYDSADSEIFSKEFIAPVNVTVENEPTEVTGSGSGGATGA